MLPSRLKLTITVMSMPGLARDAGGGFQQVRSLANTSLMLSTRSGSASTDPTHNNGSSAAANQTIGLRRRTVTAYLMSDATCTFTILSGSVTLPLDEPGGAFLSLSITSI